jgi:death-on-curing protein
MIRYLTAEQLLFLHYLVMERYDEKEHGGVIFPNRFYSLVERPKTIVFGEEIHPTLWQKAGALVQSIVQEHPFVNGNKRTAFLALIYFLELNGYTLQLSNEDAVELMVRFAIDDQLKGEDGPKHIGEIIKSMSVESERKHRDHPS